MSNRKEIDKLLKQLEQEPDDARLQLKIADLMIADGEVKRANDLCEQTAMLYAKQGFFLKGVAVAKKVLERDRTRLTLRESLAQLYEKLGLSTDAGAQYAVLLQEYEALGFDTEAARAKAAMERLGVKPMLE